ncbi:MAG TPA: FAD-dependent monooxygenase [bacterium]|nr:FAD-dependent monooxygenase [bacterium]
MDESAREGHQTACCIVGGGPAGVMLARLLSRRGVPTVLLEEHTDFDRQFRVTRCSRPRSKSWTSSGWCTACWRCRAPN